MIHLLERQQQKVDRREGRCLRLSKQLERAKLLLISSA